MTPTDLEALRERVWHLSPSQKIWLSRLTPEWRTAREISPGWPANAYSGIARALSRLVTAGLAEWRALPESRSQYRLSPLGSALIAQQVEG